jgi:hypothetical protein
MTQSLKKCVCKTQKQAIEARDRLLGEGFEIVFGPEKIDVGATDMTGIGRDHSPYAEAWVVIGKKSAE